VPDYFTANLGRWKQLDGSVCGMGRCRVKQQQQTTLKVGTGLFGICGFLPEHGRTGEQGRVNGSTRCCWTSWVMAKRKERSCQADQERLVADRPFGRGWLVASTTSLVEGGSIKRGVG
jgi:hypothetical protein